MTNTINMVVSRGATQMHYPLLIFFVSLLTGVVCVGGFLWSASEQKPKAFWLIGVGVAILVGLMGLVQHISD